VPTRRPSATRRAPTAEDEDEGAAAAARVGVGVGSAAAPWRRLIPLLLLLLLRGQARADGIEIGPADIIMTSHRGCVSPLKTRLMERAPTERVPPFVLFLLSLSLGVLRVDGATFLYLGSHCFGCVGLRVIWLVCEERERGRDVLLLLSSSRQKRAPSPLSAPSHIKQRHYYLLLVPL
jgi:hypothetical protein